MSFSVTTNQNMGGQSGCPYTLALSTYNGHINTIFPFPGLYDAIFMFRSSKENLNFRAHNYWKGYHCDYFGVNS